MEAGLPKFRHKDKLSSPHHASTAVTTMLLIIWDGDLLIRRSDVRCGGFSSTQSRNWLLSFVTVAFLMPTCCFAVTNPHFARYGSCRASEAGFREDSWSRHKNPVGTAPIRLSTLCSLCSRLHVTQAHSSRLKPKFGIPQLCPNRQREFQWVEYGRGNGFLNRAS